MLYLLKKSYLLFTLHYFMFRKKVKWWCSLKEMFYYQQFFILPCLLIFFGNLSRNQQISVYNITKLYYYMILHPFCIVSLLCHVHTYKNAVKGMHTQIKIKLVMFFIICLSFLCNILLRHFVL